MSEVATRAFLESSDLEFEFESGGFCLRTPAQRILRGERIACVGPSGSGKSTFLALLAGILNPTRGSIGVEGEVWSGLSDAQRRSRRLENVGFVFQEFELLDHLSVRENILLQSAFSSGAERESRVEELARAAGIADLLARSPRRLSQGERQRTAVCRALVQQPKLLLADEPTGNLDERTSGIIRELMLSEAAEHGSTLVVATHDLSFAASLDRVLDFEEFAK